MHRSPSAVFLLLAACSTAQPAAEPAPPHLEHPPGVAQVTNLAPGTRFVASLAPAADDAPERRAALVWWREALRQSVAFELVDAKEPTLPRLELAVELSAKTVAATWRQGGVDTVLAGGNFRQQPLHHAIDQLAWACRLALGEAVAATPVACGLGTSTDPGVLQTVLDAEALLADGGPGLALAALRRARQRDGGAPFVLEPLAAVTLTAGDVAGAERLAREALNYPPRLLPTTLHRLGRTMLLARASLQPALAARYDAELAQLAATSRRERPHDPQPVLSAALAANFQGDFATAQPLLAGLQQRLPGQAIVDYHLGYACLGRGEAMAAVQHFTTAARRLPLPWILIPRAIALFEAGDGPTLAAWLDEIMAAPDCTAELRYRVLRMRAAVALAAGEGARCRAGILTTLRLLLQEPLLLEPRVGEFAEMGALLVRLGGDDNLLSLLQAIQAQHPGGLVADACAYVQGLASIAATPRRLPELEAELGRGGDSAFGALLAAYAHERRGELGDQEAQLARAAQLSDRPSTKALLGRCLLATGRTEPAQRLLQTLRRELRSVRLRQAPTHPVLGPELMFAVLDG